MSKDLVVIGGGLGGLSAAIHARLKGWNVLLLEQHEKCGGKAGRIQIGGYSLDPGPSIIILPRIYEDVFRLAGRRPEDYLKFRRLDPVTRVFFGGQAPFDLPADETELFRLVEQYAPEDARCFRELMPKLRRVASWVDQTIFSRAYDRAWMLADPRLAFMGMQFDPRKSYKELVDGLFKSSLLRAFFYGFPSYSGQTYHSKAAGALLIPYYMFAEGVWYPAGGVASIPEAFEKLALELGVEIRRQSKVVALELANKRVARAALADGSRVEADSFISNADRLTTQEWLGSRIKSKPSFSYFTLHWGLGDGSALEHHNLFVPSGFEAGFKELYEERIFPTKPIVYVNVTSRTDPSVSPAGRANVFAVVTTPGCEEHLDWNIDLYRERALATLRSCGVDLDASHADFERVQSPLYFQEVHGNYKGSLYGPDEKERLFGGLLPLRNRDKSYRNLFYAGGSVQPGAGLPMVTLSGRFAADALGLA